jgi:hypothetical protein
MLDRPSVVRGAKGKSQRVARENIVTPARAVKEETYSELRS